MQYFRSLCLSLILFLLFAAGVFSQESSQEKEEEKQIRPPVGLVRVDLLAQDIKKLDPPKRNIFVPNSASRVEADEPEEMNKNRQVEQQIIEALETEQLSTRPPGLRYIGYVKSTQKITALILFEGEALAVDVGEEIAEGVSITKITLDAIMVTGPAQEPWNFPLEGETR